MADTFNVLNTVTSRMSPHQDIKEVSLNQALRMIVHNYRAQFNNRNFLAPIFLMGHPGVGKTSIIHQAAKQLSAELGVDVNVVLAVLLYMDKLDFYGPVVDQNDMDAPVVNRRTRYVPKDGNTLLFFDEGNRASVGTSNGLLTLFDPKVRSVNDHRLGDNVMPVMAGNVLTEDQQTMHIVDFCAALNDRIVYLMIKLTFKEHYSYLANKYSESNNLVQFLSKNPTFVSYEGEGGITPRRFEEGIKQIEGVESGELDFMHFNLCAVFGKSAGDTVAMFLNGIEAVPGFPDVITGKGEVFDWIKKNGNQRIDFIKKFGEELRSYNTELSSKGQKVSDDVKSYVEQALLLLTSEIRVGIIRSEQNPVVRRHIVTSYFSKNDILRRETEQALDTNPRKSVA